MKITSPKLKILSTNLSRLLSVMILMLKRDQDIKLFMKESFDFLK